MAQPERAPSVQSSRRRQRRTEQRHVLQRFWTNWWVEILIVLLVALAAFLLTERAQIRNTVLGWLQQGTVLLRGAARGVLERLARSLASTSLSDMIGYGLLVAAVAFVIWRIRWRLMTMPRFTKRECRQCGAALHRIHRTRVDRVINLFVPVARYWCKNPDCGWRGLRVRRSKHS